MKILVTGGAGFIGSAVIRLALSRGHSVVNLDALTYASNLKNLSSVAGHPGYFFELADIRDRAKLDAIFEQHQPDAVMHLAAESHVDRSIDGPADIIETNVLGTFNLLESARTYWQAQGAPDRFRFHHVSTDEVYGSLPHEPEIKFTESSRYSPHSPYSASKAGSDHLVRAWGETYQLPVIVTNCSNNYGPYQFPEKLVPVTVINALRGSALPVYGDGSHVRDWLYVEDHVEALLLALASGEAGRTYNIGGESECSNLELVRTICAILDRLHPRADGALHSQLITLVPDRPGHDARYAIDTARIRTELDWRPTMPLAKGLESTVKWYLENEAWWHPLMQRDGASERLGRLST